MTALLRLLSTALVLALALFGRAEASSLTAHCSISTGSYDCSVTKNFDALDPLYFNSFSVVRPTTIRLSEAINNGSGTDWSDFHWGVEIASGTFSSLQITSITNLTEFGKVSGEGAQLATVTAGTVRDGGSFAATVEIAANGEGYLNIVETPSIETPEPATLALLGLGLAGLGAASRRRRTA